MTERPWGRGLRERRAVQLLPLPLLVSGAAETGWLGEEQKGPPWPARGMGAGGSCPCRSVWGRTGLTETDTVGLAEKFPDGSIVVQGKLRQERNSLLTHTPHTAQRN